MIAEFESRILALIDDMVEHASDDELFASGYLRGHLTLVVVIVLTRNGRLQAGCYYDFTAERIDQNACRTRSGQPAVSAYRPAAYVDRCKRR